MPIQPSSLWVSTTRVDNVLNSRSRFRARSDESTRPSFSCPQTTCISNCGSSIVRAPTGFLSRASETAPSISSPGCVSRAGSKSTATCNQEASPDETPARTVADRSSSDARGPYARPGPRSETLRRITHGRVIGHTAPTKSAATAIVATLNHANQRPARFFGLASRLILKILKAIHPNLARCDLLPFLRIEWAFAIAVQLALVRGSADGRSIGPYGVLMRLATSGPSRWKWFTFQV